MPLQLPIYSQSEYLVQVVDINLHTEWQTVQKPTDLDLYCLPVCKGSVYPGSAGQGLMYRRFFTRTRLTSMLYFLIAAHKDSCQISSKTYLKSMKTGRWRCFYPASWRWNICSVVCLQLGNPLCLLTIIFFSVLDCFLLRIIFRITLLGFLIGWFCMTGPAVSFFVRVNIVYRDRWVGSSADDCINSKKILDILRD